MTTRTSPFAFLFGFALSCAIAIAASGCATVSVPTERGVPAELLAAGVPDVPLVSDERLDDFENDGYGAGLKPSDVLVLSDIDEEPRAPLFDIERLLVIEGPAERVFATRTEAALDGLVDADILRGAFYVGRKAPESAVAKTAPPTAAE